MKNYLKVIAAASMLFGLVQMTVAQPEYGQGFGRKGSQGPGPGAGQADCPRWIPDLTEEQQAQIASLRTAHLKEVQPLQGEIKINKAKIDALMIQDAPDSKAIDQLIEANGKLLTEIQKKNIAHKLEVRKLLTDEQKVQFDSGMGCRNMRMHDRDCRFRDF